jgi:hypothetical protein
LPDSGAALLIWIRKTTAGGVGVRTDELGFLA